MRTSEDGFTLVEVLVAFAILAVSLGILYQSYAIGATNGENTQRAETAIELAKTRLALVGTAAPLAAGETAGVFAKTPYAWRVQIRPLDESSSDKDNGLVEAFDIAVIVTWEQNGRQKNVSLHSLRLQTRAT